MRRFAAISLLLILAACTPAQHAGQQRQVIYFQEWSASLDGQAGDAVSAAADFVKQHPGVPVVVIGYADPDGSPAANKDISRVRAQVVYDALVKAGIPAAEITRKAAGSTAFINNSQESRRVEIVIDAPP